VIGGKDYKDTFTRVLDAVISNKLAVKICWVGIRKKDPKRAFMDTKLKTLLFSKKMFLL
jgi:hypothetical protein